MSIRSLKYSQISNGVRVPLYRTLPPSLDADPSNRGEIIYRIDDNTYYGSDGIVWFPFATGSGGTGSGLFTNASTLSLPGPNRDIVYDTNLSSLVFNNDMNFVFGGLDSGRPLFTANHKLVFTAEDNNVSPPTYSGGRGHLFAGLYNIATPQIFPSYSFNLGENNEFTDANATNTILSGRENSTSGRYNIINGDSLTNIQMGYSYINGNNTNFSNFTNITNNNRNIILCNGNTFETPNSGIRDTILINSSIRGTVQPLDLVESIMNVDTVITNTITGGSTSIVRSIFSGTTFNTGPTFAGNMSINNSFVIGVSHTFTSSFNEGLITGTDHTVSQTVSNSCILGGNSVNLSVGDISITPSLKVTERLELNQVILDSTTPSPSSPYNAGINNNDIIIIRNGFTGNINIFSNIRDGRIYKICNYSNGNIQVVGLFFPIIRQDPAAPGTIENSNSLILEPSDCIRIITRQIPPTSAEFYVLTSAGGRY